jgi:ribosomal protein S18 acetylase RimI-like enzyme
MRFNAVNTRSVRLAVSNDIESWLILAREAEPLFGPMAEVPEFKDALAEAIAGKQAFVSLRDSDEFPSLILGGIVISKEENSIEWLAVSASVRGFGIGGKLLETALNHLNPARPVAVQTFASSVPEGLTARHLYQKFGFEERQHMGPNPAGIDTVLMTKAPSSQPG